MKKAIVFLSTILILLPLVSFANINKSHIKSVVQILIYDNAKQEYISSGSGVSIGGATILTNYHVVEDIIKYPNNYAAIICITEKSQSVPECNYMAHAYYAFGLFQQQEAHYSESLDLALIYINWKKNTKGEWESIADLPISEYLFDSIDLSIYGFEMTGIELGDEVQTLGYPDYANDTIAYTNGVISSFWMDDGSIFKNHHGVLAVVTDAKISYGSSGGAAFDEEGYFLGITSAGIEDDNSNFLAGVIIPVTTVNWWWEKELGYSIYDWGGIGYTTGEIPENTLKEALCLLRINKHFDELKGECVCDAGYTEKTPGGDCVKEVIEDIDCPLNSQYINGSCKCDEGYAWIDNPTRCIKLPCPTGYMYHGRYKTLGGGYLEYRCLTIDEVCKEDYGQNSYYTRTDDDGTYYCSCEDGYEWNDERTTCIEKIIEQTSLCPEGYVFWGDKCITYDDSCIVYYGIYSHWTGEFNKDGNYICDCKDGYQWNGDRTTCVNKVIVKGHSSSFLDKDSVIQEEKSLITKIDKNLSKRVSGNILLQVEKNGEGWYVYPDDKKKYYLGRPADAFSIMRKLGLGATHEFITNNTIFPDHVLGKILLDVEQNGEAYYIYPKDKKAYYLGRPTDAFRIMRELGLGITNDDVRKIDVGEIE